MTDFASRYANEPLDGKYRLLERLGAGGMGEVYKAEHVMLGATRVIKIVRPQISSSTEAHDRFMREARLATKVHHHNVATLHDFASLPDGAHYMVWEYIDGENMSQLTRRRGPLPPRLAIRLIGEALAGLDAVHRAGIVHRDISPENLMVTRDEEGVEHVKIIDLGVAKAEEGDTGLTGTGMFVGKLRYASPEHLGFLPEGERIDGRADLYSLAIVLYEMLTGRAPFEATSPHQYYVRYSREEALTPVDLAAVPGGPELQAVLARALERDRNRRFPNAREFAEALQRAGAAIPDTGAMKTMALAPDADLDATMRVPPATQSQTPFQTTVRTDYGTPAPAPVDEYVPPPPPPVTPTPPPPTPPPPASPPTVIDRAPMPRRSPLLPVMVGAGVVLMLAFVGLLAYAARPLLWKGSQTATTTAAAVAPTQTTSSAASQTTVDVNAPSTTSAAATTTLPASTISNVTTTTATPPPRTTTTATVAETKPKPKPQPKTVTTEPEPEPEETEAPAPQPSTAQVRTYVDGKGDSTWNNEAKEYARRQLSGVKSVAVQGSASGDPALREELEQLLARNGIAVSPSADTVIRFHGKIERRSLGRKTRFADATIARHGRVVFHYQLPLEDYRVGDSPAEAFARVASDLFR